MLESLLTSTGCCSTGIESNMENAITAAPEVKKIENTNRCKKKGGDWESFLHVNETFVLSNEKKLLFN